MRSALQTSGLRAPWVPLWAPLWVLLCLCCLFGSRPASADNSAIGITRLPAEARDTLALIARGGPFPHRRDGIVFNNYERRLPVAPRGYYHEYTVPTPGRRDRGARRIVTGGNPPTVFYYTDDHYRSFYRIQQ